MCLPQGIVFLALTSTLEYLIAAHVRLFIFEEKLAKKQQNLSNLCNNLTNFQPCALLLDPVWQLDTVKYVNIFV